MNPEKTLSDALDEIYALRRLLASEARVLEAHLDYKTFPKSRRAVAEESVRLMRDAVRGTVKPRIQSRREYTLVYGTQTLTMYEWQHEGAEVPE